MKVAVRGLVQRYGSHIALDHITMAVDQGILGLLGPNGAGKSTLLRILATIQPVTEGEVNIGGYQLGRDNPHIRHRLGYLPQEFGLYRSLTGWETLEYAAHLKGHSARDLRQEISHLGEAVNLTTALKLRVGAYSGGMKQRLGIAMALLGDPQLVIFDEPTAGLDPEERVRLRQLLSELAQRKTIILSTHIVADVEEICNSLAVLKRGRLEFCGSLSEILGQITSQVWSAELELDRWERIKDQVIALSVQRFHSTIGVRLLATTPPLPEAVPTEATLEDAYLALQRTETMGEGGAR